MIRTQQPPPDLTATTTEAHVRAVAKECGLPVVPAGEWLYVIRRVPLLGAPIVYRARCDAPRSEPVRHIEFEPFPTTVPAEPAVTPTPEEVPA